MKPFVGRVVIDLNPGWRFRRDGDAEERVVDLPHDWAIEGPFSREHNCRTGALPVSGIGWYRQRFATPAADSPYRWRVEFDGAMSDATVWLNGHELGFHPNGYTPFGFDVTDRLSPPGKENVLEVRLCPPELASRWYPGAGLHRPVRLVGQPPVFLDPERLWPRRVARTNGAARVEVVVGLRSLADREAAGELDVEWTRPGSAGAGRCPVRLPAGVSVSHTIVISVPDPEWWSPESPALYELRATLRLDDGTEDRLVRRTGLRELAWSAADGFRINGERVRFRGVCLHHDQGGLGTAVNPHAVRRQLTLMKQMGANAVRTSHNPPATELLDLCDELGLLVMVEAFDGWEAPKTPNDGHRFFKQWHERDLRALLRRDRRHPSVVMWSVGNEMPEQDDPVNGPRIARRLTEICREEDPTRPVTAGFNRYPEPLTHGLAEALDVVGLNYKSHVYARALADFPGVAFLGTETCSCVSSRGVYTGDAAPFEPRPDLQVPSTDDAGPHWSCPPEVEELAQRAHPALWGQFVWTGIDYLGEPTPYGGRDHGRSQVWNRDYPARSSYFGAVDLAGFPKDRYHLYRAMWTDDPVMHVATHWNWEGREGQPVRIPVYTNLDVVELFLNGRSLGGKDRKRDAAEVALVNKHDPRDRFRSPWRLLWEAAYEPGGLTAVGFRGGGEAARIEIRTAGVPARLRLVADRTRISSAEREPAFVTVRVEDEAGVLVPRGDTPIRFELEGPGTLLAVDNGNPATTESFQASVRRAFHGLALAVVAARPGAAGEIRLHAGADGLEGAVLTFHAAPGSGLWPEGRQPLCGTPPVTSG